MENVEQRALAYSPANSSFWIRYFDGCIIHPIHCGTWIRWEIDVLYRNMERPRGTGVYCNATHTNKCLSFYSHHPRSHKKSVARTLFERAESLTSNRFARDNERDYVFNVLKGNNHSQNFLTDCLKAQSGLNQMQSLKRRFLKKLCSYSEHPRICGANQRIMNYWVMEDALKLFQTSGHFREIQESCFDQTYKKHTLYTLYHVMIARKNIWVKQNVSCAHV